MKNQYFAGVALIALAIPGTAFAQSTGSIDFEEEIIVTGSKEDNGLAGVVLPDTPKAQTVLTQEVIQAQSAGQSILNAINVVPSVNFTNNDPYGSSGGNIRIRGFDGNRISLTWDGMPLNDTGNYAIFSNQMLDQEIISQVNVNQGTTDVDSPTASAAGGTVNYRTMEPTDDMGGIIKASYGDFGYHRVLGVLQSGEFTSFGTKLFGSASYATNKKFRGVGGISKQQYNLRVYQPLGGNDFIAIGGHFNRNRNNFYRNLNLAQIQADYFTDGKANYDNNAFCARPTFVGGTAQSEANFSQPSTAVPTTPLRLTGLDTSCTNFHGVRINPSDTGNIRINSKFELTDKLTLTVDPSFQYVLANGGGFSTLSERDARARGALPNQYLGVDFSGDGDVLDTVAFYTPNTTNTYRYTLLASLRYELNDDHSVRIAYAFDRGRHRQTGEWGYLDAIGNPQNVFGGNQGLAVRNADGSIMRQRDRLSIALLNQLSAEYRGKFMDDALELQVGLRSPWFKRRLDQRCYTQANNGNQLCTTQPVAGLPGTGGATSGTNGVAPLNIISPTAVVPTAGTFYYAPYKATYSYHKILPNVGLTFKPVDDVSIFASYAMGFSSPRTDNLYRAPNVAVKPETSNNVDAGIRYTTGTTQVSLGAFYNKFKNRIVTSFDQGAGISVDRNVGSVTIKGLEASIDVKPVSWFSFRGFGSYIDGKLGEDLNITSTVVLPTKGKFLVETPKWQYGYRAQVTFDPISVGANYKHVGSRFATDLNDIRVPGYNTFDLDARFSFKKYGLDKVFVQLNVSNLFNEKYLGSISSQIVGPTVTSVLIPGIPVGQTVPTGSNPTFAYGSPRAISATLQIGF